MMKRFTVRSLAAIAALAPALACASRSVSVGSPEAGSAAASNTRTIGSVGAPVGLQLWSLRSMSKDPAAMFSLARSMGVTHVETAGLNGMTPEQFAAALRGADLRATSMHIGLDEFKKNPQNVIGTAKALGVKYVGTAWYPHQGAFTEADARKAIADFNAIGKTMKAAGLQFFYHNHGYEPVKFGDGTLLDLMIRETDPDLVKFEMDVLWTFLPNVDPAALIRKYPGRFKLMHIKDMKPGVARGSLSGGLPDSLQAVIGQGQVNWPEVLKAAKADGLEYYYLEDETTDPVKNIPPSISYLQGIRF
jgi:sugar phosphate isomerase/epimerase